MQEEKTLQMPVGASQPREEDRDLGFGSVVAGESRQRLLNQDGTFNVQRTGLPFLSSLNLYHTVISMSWKEFIGLTLLLYFLSNIVFGIFYSAFGASALVDTSEIPIDNLFLRGFFFSVQTFATIGYGTIHPVGIIPNLLVTIESYYSMIITALITGIVFARFARPTAKVLFSEIARRRAVSRHRSLDVSDGQRQEQSSDRGSGAGFIRPIYRTRRQSNAPIRFSRTRKKARLVFPAGVDGCPSD